MRPLFSIITVTFNRAECLERCLNSVAGQQGTDVEHIVIDGGSNDGTRELLQRWAGRLAYWISESDNGIADAMNKGIVRANGEWLLFLHSDDELWAPDSLSEVARVLGPTQAGIVGFPIRFGDRNSHRVYDSRGGTPWMRFKTGFPHQGAFIRRSLFSDIGMHDTELRFDMDYDFFLRAWTKGVAMETHAWPVPALMGAAGISSMRDWPNLLKRFREERIVHMRYAGTWFWRIVYRLYWPPYLLYRWLGCVLARS